MGTAALGIAAVVLVVGCFLGWHLYRANAADSDIKTTHTTSSGYGSTRLRSGLIMLGLVVVAVLVVSALFHHSCRPRITGSASADRRLRCPAADHRVDADVVEGAHDERRYHRRHVGAAELGYVV